ncbi:hypothetical protein HGRIS_001709 [Hohenbuehelia grisea]|uniref:BTB domain-containing protein n=1 Tax=Hohenbuehelia grisea TaxID=104357 RepID=A0ABR3JIF3_9AGAR
MQAELLDADRTPGGSFAYKGGQPPTPPQSPKGLALPQIDGNTLVSVSTTFSPASRYHGMPPNFAILSADSVFFYVHTSVLASTSHNGFRGLLDDGNHDDGANRAAKALLDPATSSPPIRVCTSTDHSTTLNVILHAVYGFSCVQYAPSTNTLVEAVDLFPIYGLVAEMFIHPGVTPTSPTAQPTPLYTLLMTHSPVHPLVIYSLAAHHNLHALAVATSEHLLSTPLHSVTDQAATRMGPIYLKKLAFLHLGRAEALKRIVEAPPPVHAPTRLCGADEQQRLSRAWMLAVAYLSWDARADVPVSMLDSALRTLGDHLDCHLCQYNLRDRIRDVTVQWLGVKRTI